jgi:hypothetical protein
VRGTGYEVSLSPGTPSGWRPGAGSLAAYLAEAHAGLQVSLAACADAEPPPADPLAFLAARLRQAAAPAAEPS